MQPCAAVLHAPRSSYALQLPSNRRPSHRRDHLTVGCLAPPAEPLLGGAASPAPPPHDPAAVPSVVRWGTKRGELKQRTEGDAGVVYTYTYGQGGFMGCAGGWRRSSRRSSPHTVQLNPRSSRPCLVGAPAQLPPAGHRPAAWCRPEPNPCPFPPSLPALPPSPPATARPRQRHVPQPHPASRDSQRPAPRHTLLLLCGCVG